MLESDHACRDSRVRSDVGVQVGPDVRNAVGMAGRGRTGAGRNVNIIGTRDFSSSSVTVQAIYAGRVVATDERRRYRFLDLFQPLFLIIVEIVLPVADGLARCD